MTKTYLIKEDEIDSDKYEQFLEQELKPGFKPGMSVAVKLHMGEDKGMFSPELAKRAVKILKKLGCKPFLVDTPVKYAGSRHTKEGYEKTAAEHGFTEEAVGCPVIISDDYVDVNTEHMGVVEVSKHIAEADAMLVLSHFKGHPCCAFGGAVKNLAMGGVSPKSKGDQHGCVPVINDADACSSCGVCVEVCPFNAVSVNDRPEINSGACAGCSSCAHNCPNDVLRAQPGFDALLAEAAFAVLKPLKQKPVFYVNDVRSITRGCDCFADPGPVIAEDVGVLLSSDLVAVDMAGLELVKEQEGKDVFKQTHNHDPYLQLEEAEKIGLGKRDYELV